MGLVAATLFAGCTRPATHGSSAKDYLVYVGTNVASEQESTIFLYRLSPATGALTRVSAQRGGASPTYMTMDAGRRFLYAVSETQMFKGAKGGGVSAFAVDRRTGDLTMLNQQPSNGASPCYISLDHSGKAAMVANYVSGTVSLLPLAADGKLAPATATDQHEGSGPHKNQNGPHAHCIIPDPANTFAFAVDLGTDKVYGYRLNPAQGQLTLMPEPAFVARPGAGPRHLTFHPNGKQAYLINELNSTVTALAYDATAGKFRELQTLSALPAGFVGDNSCADIHVSPNGQFLYASNRGHNSIAVFAIDASSGTLTPVQDVDTQGKTPRNFALDPSGRLLLVANQNSNNVVTYRIDQQTGLLTPTGQTAEVPSPMFLQVVEDFTR
ncbi:lactonase family protein [Hymenobacter sp. BT770]|uniref:lactonase family protein n=1 Tax=Hymenobacter sp. BT770 TaxID=2886942 RepID=UPI001D114417|nr:lactonase family protein [Hymenobacter sp. BT770]MCC3153982.1 lactonase family protein [Hymenobacter sp. BT770]MDO3416088.1 lactonase family protein [Hymenobacter sp. BT770]